MSEPITEGWLDPESEIVGIRGDQPPLSWVNTFKTSSENQDGMFTAAVPFNLDSDSLLVSFKIKVDGIDNPDDGWQAGRNHEATIYPGQNRRVDLSWNQKPPEVPTTFTGQIEIFRDFKSDNEKLVDRDLYIYLPPGYEENDRRYPVLYMHDGQAIFDASEIGQEWSVDEAAEELIRSGEIEPVIIVGIGNTQNRFDEYTPTRQVWRHELMRISEKNNEPGLNVFAGNYRTPEGDILEFKATSDTLFSKIPGSEFWQPLIAKSDRAFFLAQSGITFTFNENADKIIASKPDMGGDGNDYGDFIINKVKPFIDHNLRTKPEKEYTALGGSSLGGLITLYLGLKHSDVFSELLVVSPSVWWDEQMIIDEVNALSESTGQRIWLDMGTEEGEGAVESSEALYDALTSKGWTKSELEFTITKGAAHNERAWAKRVPNMLRFLYSKQ